MLRCRVLPDFPPLRVSLASAGMPPRLSSGFVRSWLWKLFDKVFPRLFFCSYFETELSFSFTILSPNKLGSYEQRALLFILR